MNEDSKLGRKNPSISSSSYIYNKVKSPKSVVSGEVFTNEVKYKVLNSRRNTQDVKSPARSIKSKRYSEERAKSMLSALSIFETSLYCAVCIN